MEETPRPLWAPWRVEFIRGEREKRCFLCDNDAPSGKPGDMLVIRRGRTAFVMLTRYPYNAGHLLVSPYRHLADLPLLSEEERAEIFELCIQSELTLRKVVSPDAFNVGFNLGSAAGAGVPDHLHMHIVPRWNGDNNFMPVLADIRCVPEALEATAALLRSNWTEA